MRQGATLGRPLLTAAIDLLTDVPDQIMVSAFRGVAGNPREIENAQHYQRVVWRSLQPMFQDGRLVAIGFREGADEPKAIHPQFFDIAEPDLIRSSLTSHGVVYTAVRVIEAATAPASLEAVEPALKGKGGRPSVHDWNAFAKEVVRFALLDGFASRRELTAHMRDWCAQKWVNPPGDETIRQKVVDLCPDGVPSE